MPNSLNQPDPPAAVPVNVAKPDWACPHCNTTYGTNYDAACACAAAGPADDVAEGVIVLNLRAERWGASGPFFGVAVPGPVTAVYEHHAVVAHRRDVTVDGNVIDSGALSGAEPGELVVISDADPQLASNVFDTQSWSLTALGVPKPSYASWTTPGVDGERPIRVVDSRDFPNGDLKWFGPLGDLRDLAQMLVGFLDELAETDPTEIADRWLNSDPRSLRRSLNGQRAALRLKMLDAVVAAHGAPDVSVATRWLTDHAEAVAEWTASQVVEWAGGGDVTIPALSWTVANLPRTPGKKRLALMEVVDCDDYQPALRAVGSRITVETPPTNPVPNLGDVVSEYLAASAAARKESL